MNWGAKREREIVILVVGVGGIRGSEGRIVLWTRRICAARDCYVGRRSSTFRLGYIGLVVLLWSSWTSFPLPFSFGIIYNTKM